jgi:hypothetical protein
VRFESAVRSHPMTATSSLLRAGVDPVLALSKRSGPFRPTSWGTAPFRSASQDRSSTPITPALSAIRIERRCHMSYLKRHGTRRVPAVGAALGPGAELGRRLHVGGRPLGAPAPLPRPRLRGRLVLRIRVEAVPRERPGGRGSPAGGRPPRGCGGRRCLARGSCTEERPGAVRAVDGGWTR